MKPVMTIDVEKLNITELFAEPTEKGSSEWSAFSPIVEDTIEAFRVALPKKALVARGAGHVLRIIYPQLRRAH